MAASKRIREAKAFQRYFLRVCDFEEDATHFSGERERSMTLEMLEAWPLCELLNLVEQFVKEAPSILELNRLEVLASARIDGQWSDAIFQTFHSYWRMFVLEARVKRLEAELESHEPGAN